MRPVAWWLVDAVAEAAAPAKDARTMPTPAAAAAHRFVALMLDTLWAPTVRPVSATRSGMDASSLIVAVIER
jgi:hypothetical protein